MRLVDTICCAEYISGALCWATSSILLPTCGYIAFMNWSENRQVDIMQSSLQETILKSMASESRKLDPATKECSRELSDMTAWPCVHLSMATSEVRKFLPSCSMPRVCVIWKSWSGSAMGDWVMWV